MKKSRFSEEQIIRILKDQDAGQTTAVVCRHHGTDILFINGRTLGRRSQSLSWR